jgi:hypothetical protein
MSDDRIKPESEAHVLALGRGFINRKPLDELKRLSASIGWSGAVGYFIPLRGRPKTNPGMHPVQRW